EQRWAEERAEAARLLKEEQEEKEAIEARAEQLKKEEEARGQIKEFRRLADELRFYAAIPDAAGGQAPPLVDLESGDARGRAARRGGGRGEGPPPGAHSCKSCRWPIRVTA